MPRFLFPAVFWLAFLETARAAVGAWSAAGPVAAESGSAPFHVCVSLALWLVAFFWLFHAVNQTSLEFFARQPPKTITVQRTSQDSNL